MIGRRPIISLTYGAVNHCDVVYASQIADGARSDHYWFDLTYGDWVKENFDFHLDLTEGFHNWIHAHGINTLPKARKLMDVNLTGWDGGTVMGDIDNIEPLQISPVDDLALISHLYYQFNQKFSWPSINEAEENLLFCPPINKQIQGRAFESFRNDISNYLDFRTGNRG